jgi:hypothetical protein
MKRIMVNQRPRRQLSSYQVKESEQSKTDPASLEPDIKQPLFIRTVAVARFVDLIGGIYRLVRTDEN